MMILILSERPPTKAPHLMLKFPPRLLFLLKLSIDFLFDGICPKNLPAFPKIEKELTAERLVPSLLYVHCI